MKTTKRQLRRIIREEKTKLVEQGFHSMSPAGKALANSIKGKFTRMYPDAMVGIDGRGGFITVNGKKALDMSQATSARMSDEEMIEKMHAVYAETQVDADVPTADSRIDTFREGKMKITKRQLRRIIREEREKLSREKLNEAHSMDSVQELSSIIDAVDEIANGVYQNDPELAQDLEMQVERLANLHDKLKLSLKDRAFRKVDDRRPTDGDGYA